MKFPYVYAQFFLDKAEEHNQKGLKFLKEGLPFKAHDEFRLRDFFLEQANG